MSLWVFIQSLLSIEFDWIYYYYYFQLVLSKIKWIRRKPRLVVPSAIQNIFFPSAGNLSWYKLKMILLSKNNECLKAETILLQWTCFELLKSAPHWIISGLWHKWMQWAAASGKNVRLLWKLINFPEIGWLLNGFIIRQPFASFSDIQFFTMNIIK